MAELSRARRDDGIGSNRLAGLGFQERRQDLNQPGNLPKQLVARKNLVLGDWDDLLEFLKPACGKELASLVDAKCDGCGEIRRDGVCHESLLRWIMGSRVVRAAEYLPRVQNHCRVVNRESVGPCTTAENRNRTLQRVKAVTRN